MTVSTEMQMETCAGVNVRQRSYLRPPHDLQCGPPLILGGLGDSERSADGVDLSQAGRIGAQQPVQLRPLLASQITPADTHLQCAIS